MPGGFPGVDNKLRHSGHSDFKHGNTVCRTGPQGLFMGGDMAGYKQQFMERESAQNIARDLYMAIVNGVEATAKNADHRAAISLYTDMAITKHDPFLRGQPFQAHRTAGVNFVCRNTDLGTESVLEAIGKPGGCINHYRTGIHRGEKA